MTYQLIKLDSTLDAITPYFVEGAVLASNFSTQPLQPEAWLYDVVGEVEDSMKATFVEQINWQYSHLKANAYDAQGLIDNDVEKLAEFSQGFMSVWPVVEEKWQQATIADGTLRMLQALLTTLMLAIDEEGVQQQMRESGIETPPCLQDMLPQLNIMINEVALAADELMNGHQSQHVNPYKAISRNDLCPCGSGNKFKQCCGK